MTGGKDRYVLADSRVDDDTGELVDTWEHEQTGDQYEKRLGGNPDDEQGDDADA